MGYGASSQPPGGWLEVFKFLLYCPDLRRPSDCWEASEGNVSCSDSLGHVQQEAGGFQTGPAVAKELRLKAQFRQDPLFVTRVCEHPSEDEDEDLPLGACRGLVQDFPNSAIAKQSKASRYLEASPQEQQSMQESAKEKCAFCGAPLFELSGNAFFEDNLAPCSEGVSEFLEIFRDFSSETFERITGNVCGEGHLTFVINYYGDCIEILQHKPMAGSGEELLVETFKVFNALVATFEDELDGDDEIDFRKHLGAFTVSQKLQRLADETEYETSNEEDTLEELRPLARLQTMPELINGIPEIARLTCKVMHRLEEMEAHRKAVIEGALEEAGVCKRGGAWPKPEAVYSFVKDPNRSLEETVKSVRQKWLEVEEKRAAEQAAQNREKAKRKAEHEAREAERKARRQLEVAEKRASRASQLVCPGSADGTKCNNTGSDACVRLACGACCRTYATGGCRRHKRR
ncbi:hypothetical protein KFL_000910100 [Klebsormidium nitens]|uniref:Uncharacterized protein n=1 Tax=Klebsormidium nitens TaxID=105231 RepID=A0A1Y1HT42_KLENI|nr:hypothetical protein KFL_000910100 [Klebsormidium nitens]|eukprot:GAQ81790.1 hypothetical protein KFL_000910100 [Klebsormidium nitens]